MGREGLCPVRWAHMHVSTVLGVFMADEDPGDALGL